MTATISALLLIALAALAAQPSTDLDTLIQGIGASVIVIVLSFTVETLKGN